MTSADNRPPYCRECGRDLFVPPEAAEAAVAADRQRSAAHLRRVLTHYPRMPGALRADLEVALSYIEIGEPAPREG